MTELVLQASDDLIARLAHENDPLRAVVELVWNAIDAEAVTVAVELERDTTGAISNVRVVDDGHGISPDEVSSSFGRIGGSWKQRSDRSRNKIRRLHGKLGEGRLRAFALGSRVTWSSVGENIVGARETVIISGNRENRDRFQWDLAPPTAARTGTTVTAYNDEQRSLGPLEIETAVPVLRSHFAPVLLADGRLNIAYDGLMLDVGPEVASDTQIPVRFGQHDAHPARVRIIEWRSGKHRAIYFGQDDDHFLHESSGSDVESQFPYSAYVIWSGLGEQDLALLTLGDMAPEPIGDLWRTVRRTIHEHFTARRHDRRRQQIDRWKDSGIYPYTGEPAGAAERAERAVFDVVSGTLVQHIPKNARDARLTLALLRDAIRHDPDKLTTILHEVVSLSDADRDTLTRLLGETTLSAVIRSANLVASRNKFLAGLEHLLFDPADSSEVGERDHLHRILERELWVFGESYHFMSSERGLTELLRNHLRLQGLPDGNVAPVRRWDGKTGRTDLHLAARCTEYDRLRHLVVELKAPDISAGRKEIDQIEDYANAILSHPAFAGHDTEWDFILVVADYDAIVGNRISGDRRELGQFFAPTTEAGRPRVRAYVRRWCDIINENKRRLEFMTTVLRHDPSIAEGLEHVRREHRDLLPDSLLTADGSVADGG